MKKEKINFVDVLRFAAFGLIIFYHMVVRLYLYGCYELSKVEPYYGNNNISFDTVGVSIFFLISGLGLMLSTKYKFQLKEYFVKRFTKIMVPFYISYLMVLAVYIVIKQGQAFSSDIPLWRIVFTLLGMDGYLFQHGIDTFYLIGEWFLGCIIIMYVLFPLFRQCIIKNKTITISFCTIGYLLLVLSGSGEWYIEFLSHLYVFVLGMYLSFYLDKIKRWMLIIVVPIICIYILYPNQLPIVPHLRTLVFTISVFIALSQFETLFSRCSGFTNFIKICCKYSFEIYLIHHVIISYFTSMMAANIHSLFDVIVVFAIEIVLMIILAVIIKFITARMINFILQKSAKQEKN